MVQKNLILALETSGRTGSVAIALGGDLLAEQTLSAPLKHSAEIFPAAADLLGRFGRKSSDVEQVYISIGPGSVTGLQIAVTIAKMMYLANSAKVVAVNTLDVIAANVIPYLVNRESYLVHRETRYEIPDTRDDSEPQEKEIKRLAVILDAKRGQFFVAVYEKQQNIWLKTVEDCLIDAEHFIEKFTHDKNAIYLIGEGLVYYADKFKADGICILDEKYWNPRARKVHQLGWQKALAGQFDNPIELKPHYLRINKFVIRTP